jgi:hypothetical protein
MAKFKYSIDLKDLRDKPFADSLAKEVVYRKELKEAGKIRFDNDCGLCIKLNERDEFNIMLVENSPREGSINAEHYGTHYWEIAIWAENGLLSIGQWTTQNDRLTEADYEDIKMHLDKFTDGYIRCSKCREWINVQDSKQRRYYAGIYCQTCWEGGIAAQAAADDYE